MNECANNIARLLLLYYNSNELSLFLTAMATIQVRVSDEDKKAAEQLFRSLGLDLTTAIRVFIKQSILTGGLPFDVSQHPTSCESGSETAGEGN